MKLYQLATFVLLSTNTPIARATYTDKALFRQTFEGSTDDNDWDFSNLIEVQDNKSSGGSDLGHLLRVSYPPSHNGSPRVLNKFQLNEEVTSATLSFDLKLHDKFEFVLGGKLHGLGGGSTTAGCKAIDPNGWTVRLLWKERGVPSLYIYHQDRVARCGDEFRASSASSSSGNNNNNNGFKFERGRWYRIDLQVQMNTNPFAFDGRALLYVDGERLVEANGLRLSGNANVDIDSFLFSTFYGGGNSDWSPSKTTYAYFDNFSVHRDLQVTGERGTECELFLNGIYSSSKRVCCVESCGSCGGPGCTNLPGGEWNCCTGLISRGHVMCDSVDSAPCKFEEEDIYHHQSPHLGPFVDLTESTTDSTTASTTTTISSFSKEKMQQCHSYLQMANLHLFNMKKNNRILDTTEYVVFLNNLAKTLHPNHVQWITFDDYHDLPDHLITNFVNLSCFCVVDEPDCCIKISGIYIGDGTDSSILDDVCQRTLEEMEELRLEILKGIFSAP